MSLPTEPGDKALRGCFVRSMYRARARVCRPRAAAVLKHLLDPLSVSFLPPILESFGGIFRAANCGLQTTAIKGEKGKAIPAARVRRVSRVEGSVSAKPCSAELTNILIFRKPIIYAP